MNLLEGLGRFWCRKVVRPGPSSRHLAQLEPRAQTLPPPLLCSSALFSMQRPAECCQLRPKGTPRPHPMSDHLPSSIQRLGRKTGGNLCCCWEFEDCKPKTCRKSLFSHFSASRLALGSTDCLFVRFHCFEKQKTIPFSIEDMQNKLKPQYCNEIIQNDDL